jgi:hypothetical protein
MLEQKIVKLNKAFIILISLWLILNIADSLLTIHNLSISGGKEVGILFQWTQSIPAMMIIKWIAVTAISIVLFFTKDQKAYGIKITTILWIMNFWMIFVVGWNIWQATKF